MFMEGRPSGDCPSLERRRERRGAASEASECSVRFRGNFSKHGLDTDDASHI